MTSRESTATRRRGQSLHLNLSGGIAEDLPPIAAAFLVVFDVKAGYTVAWKRSIPGLELNESVEFKSLPSGLHNVREDIIYFIHDEEYVGISAFVNKLAEESERNALMLAVGALVPLSAAGRLGKSWKHAAGLKELAKSLSKDPAKPELLENYWSKYQIHDGNLPQEQSAQPDRPSPAKAKPRHRQTSPTGQQQSRKRAITVASALAPPGQVLSPHHPALSLPALLDDFGPLIFPLYKAALLRKRILLVGHAPVELACSYVYNISILSAIPSSVFDLIPLEQLPTRLRPLFTVGIHDMQTLTEGSRNQSCTHKVVDDSMGYGWVANTTDDILSLKDQLYDVLLTIPAPYSKEAKQKVWPKIKVNKGREVKATQRDLRRYRSLRSGLRRFPSSQSPHVSRIPNGDEAAGDLPLTNGQETYDDASSTLEAQLAETQAWPALVYDSFLWWASAGEKLTDLEEEEEYDAALMRQPDSYDEDSSPSRPRSARKSPGRSPGMESMDTQPAGLEVMIVAYFHRLTTLILKTLADIVDASDYSDVDSEANGYANSDTEESSPLARKKDASPEDEETILVNSEDMSRMGLDIWSESDREFVRELVAFYWGRKADVRGGRIECCGVRIC